MNIKNKIMLPSVCIPRTSSVAFIKQNNVLICEALMFILWTRKLITTRSQTLLTLSDKMIKAFHIGWNTLKIYKNAIENQMFGASKIKLLK